MIGDDSMGGLFACSVHFWGKEIETLVVFARRTQIHLRIRSFICTVRKWLVYVSTRKKDPSAMKAVNSRKNIQSMLHAPQTGGPSLEVARLYIIIWGCRVFWTIAIAAPHPVSSSTLTHPDTTVVPFLTDIGFARSSWRIFQNVWNS